jgi:diadenosine tetraphosphatase ApaH/serine/threonine PP2A family protein phosphatase
MSADNGKSPQRLGIISDIHANLEALEAVLNALEDATVDQIVCCGDVVGYGASPNECVALLRERGIPSVMGNHDAAVLDDDELAHFNRIARDAVVWTREIIEPENLKWLREQPMSLAVGDALIVHASPQEPEKWNYVLYYSDAIQAFEHFSELMCFIGHSHQPFFITLRGKDIAHQQQSHITLGEDERHLINVGSVGQPRDRDSRAAYVIADFAAGCVNLERAEYDIETAQEKIRCAGAPPELAERLALGC